MKNQQINKFLLMFFVSFTLFFSVSNAEFTSTPVNGTSIDYTNSFSSNTIYYQENNVNIAYSYNSINSIVKDYVQNPGNSDYKIAFDTLINYFENDLNKNVFVTTFRDNQYRYFLFTDKDNSFDVGIYGDRLLFSPNDGVIYFNGCDYLDDVRQGYYSNSVVPYSSNYGYSYVNCVSLIYHTPSLSIKQLSRNSNYDYFWDGESYYYEAVTEPEIPTMTDTEFSAMLNEITTSELFYQHIPSDYRSNFYVQYDVNSDNYLFYFYPSNYQVYGLLRNENDYNVICDKDFSWWDNVVDFISKVFVRETENLDYKMIYVSVLDDGTYSCWYRSKLMSSVDETLFNLELNPIVYSSVQIPFYGKHGGGGINIDTGDKTLASSPEHVINDSVYGESNIVYNPNRIETVPNEQSFWDKVVNRLSSIVTFIKDIPSQLIEGFHSKMGVPTIIKLALPLITGILTIVNVLISSIALISRAVTFVYTLPTIEASSALFSVDVAETTTGLSFVGHNWGAKFLEGLDMLKSFSWNGLNLWNLFSAFIAAVFAIQVIKYVRKHYHY